MFENQSKLSTIKRPSTKTLLIAAAVALIVLSVVAGYFIWRTIALSQDPAIVNQQKTTNIVQKVGMIYALPNEQPTVAQISDKEKLKEQPFFAKAQNGDYLLLFQTEKIAIIYRESDNKIITAGPITGAEQGTQAP